jgi:hypothetical protein
MKVYILLLILASQTEVGLQAQTSNWFFTVTSGFNVGGPGTSIKRNMEENHSISVQLYHLYEEVLNILIGIMSCPY